MSNAKILNNLDALTARINDLTEQMNEFQKILEKILQFMSSDEYDEETEGDYTDEDELEAKDTQ